MLRSIKQLYGDKLGASDGEIGHVKDFYFDDQNWAIRYVVADTGSWLTGRQVLISPHSIGRLDQSEKVLRVKLTRKQIEESPSIGLHKPVSRQYEEEYHQYYGWPAYWQGDGLWGMSGFPVGALPPQSLPDKLAAASGTQPGRADAHLRSTQAVNGYHIKASDGMIGHVCDFMMDDKSWAIRELVVETGHWYSGREILIPPGKVERISYEESKVFVKLTKAEIQKAAANDLAEAGAGHR